MPEVDFAFEIILTKAHCCIDLNLLMIYIYTSSHLRSEDAVLLGVMKLTAKGLAESHFDTVVYFISGGAWTDHPARQSSGSQAEWQIQYRPALSGRCSGESRDCRRLERA